MSLTDTAIRNAKSLDKPYKLIYPFGLFTLATSETRITPFVSTPTAVRIQREAFNSAAN